MKKMRLAKYLSLCGIAARRKCEALIQEGRVRLNGQVVYKPETHVDQKDLITLNGKKVPPPEEKVYYALNKPKGYHCSPIPKARAKMVLDLLKKEKKRLFTVGRLDRDTTGLLIVTNDGSFANKVAHPSSNIHREYIVKTQHEVTEVHLKKIREGGHVEQAFVKPIRVQKLRRGTIKIVVSEGRKREVRTLVANAGLDVLELKRTRLGGLLLGKLPIGSYRALFPYERELIF